jgi:selenocysteine lyase/cysteine desulfurase
VRAFGVDGAARASLAPYSTDADVDALLSGVAELAENARVHHRPKAASAARL